VTAKESVCESAAGLASLVIQSTAKLLCIVISSSILEEYRAGFSA
jgi:hypothetical protein